MGTWERRKLKEKITKETKIILRKISKDIAENVTTMNCNRKSKIIEIQTDREELYSMESS